MNARMNLTTQVLLVIFILLACEIGLLGWVGSLLKQSYEKTDHERSVIETIDHLERLSMLREKATSGLLQQQMFLKDDRDSLRYKETFGKYIEAIPEEMRIVVEKTQDDADVATDARQLQQIILSGTKEMVFERDLYLTGKDDSMHVLSLNRAANAAAQLTKQILDHYKNLEQEAKRRESESRRNLDAALVVAVVLNIVFALSLASLFVAGILRRLNVVTENSKKLALGIPLSAPMQGKDEIANLDHVFHGMAKALEEATHKERAIVENAVDIICSVDSRLKFAAVNPASQAVLGFSQDDLLGKNILNIIAPEMIDDARHSFENIMHTEAKSEFETILVTKSGAQVDVLCSARWSPQERAIFCVLHDISQAKEMDRLKREFAAMVSHDLRTPLSSIMGTIEMFTIGIYDSTTEVGKKRLNTALSNVNRLLNLVNDLLDVEKLDAGKMKMDFQTMNVADAVKKSIDAVASVAENHGVKVASEVPEINISGDEDRLIQVMVNLLSNAIKFSPKDSSVCISADLEISKGANEFCELQITDQGRGIPEDQVPLLFERFRQTEKKDGKRGVGTGLGLAISKAIVEGHDGTIKATSELGKGTTIWIRLPVSH